MTELPTLPLSPLETPDEAWTPGLLQLLTEPPGLHVDLGIAVTMKPHLPGDCRIDSYQQGSATYSAKPDLGKCILWELGPSPASSLVTLVTVRLFSLRLGFSVPLRQMAAYFEALWCCGIPWSCA